MALPDLRGPPEPADASLVKPQVDVEPQPQACERDGAVLTPTAAQVVALAAAPPSRAACRRMSTQSSGSAAGARPRGRSRSRGRAGSFSPLQRVEYVEVSARRRRGGHSLYVVDVYLQRRSARQRLSDCVYGASGSSLSPRALDEVMRAERESDYRVEHRFGEFAALRASLTRLASANSHDAKQCEDCGQLRALGERRRFQALALRRVFSTERARRELLADFVNSALELAARFSDLLEEEEEEEWQAGGSEAAASVASGSGCDARAKAVALVDDFLRRPFASSLGII